MAPRASVAIMLTTFSQLRTHLSPWIQSNRAPRRRVLVASVPRCGSTYLFRSIANHGQGGQFPDAPDRCFVRDPRQLPGSTYMKTHGLAPPSVPEDVRVVFIFGDPIRAIVSTRQRCFNWTHFLNCGYESHLPPEIYARDELGYEQIFDSWMQPKPYPVLALRYERVHEHEPELTRFLGRRMRLLARCPRRTRVSRGLRRRLMPVYGDFVRKVDASPDVSLWGPGGESYPVAPFY